MAADEVLEERTRCMLSMEHASSLTDAQGDENEKREKKIESSTHRKSSIWTTYPDRNSLIKPMGRKEQGRKKKLR